jgi:hypothetical protein
MTLADDCSFGSADESEWRSLGATSQSPFSKWLFRHSALCLVFPLDRSVLGKEGLSGEPVPHGQTATVGADRVASGVYLIILRSHYRFFNTASLS